MPNRDPGQIRETDEWRVEVELHEEAISASFADRLHALRLDDNARKRLGGAIVVTRDGAKIFLYSWHEQFAREAEAVVREQLERDGLAAEVSLTRWHPVEDAWKPAEVPLPQTEEELDDERRRHEQAEAFEQAESGHYDWEVVIHMPDRRSTVEFGRELEARDLPVKRRWRYLLVGALTEEQAIELGKELELEAPEDARVGIRANPDDMPLPAFLVLGSLKPNTMRDLGI